MLFLKKLNFSICTTIYGDFYQHFTQKHVYVMLIITMQLYIILTQTYIVIIFSQEQSDYSEICP